MSNHPDKLFHNLLKFAKLLGNPFVVDMHGEKPKGFAAGKFFLVQSLTHALHDGFTVRMIYVHENGSYVHIDDMVGDVIPSGTPIYLLSDQAVIVSMEAYND